MRLYPAVVSPCVSSALRVTTRHYPVFCVLDDASAIIFILMLRIAGALDSEDNFLQVVVVFLHAARSVCLMLLYAHGEARTVYWYVLAAASLVMTWPCVLLKSQPAADILKAKAAISFVATTAILAILRTSAGADTAEVRPNQDESGLSRLRQQTLRNFTLNEQTAGDEETCMVCLRDFQENDVLLELMCGHTYHEACIREWFLGEGRACPLRCKARKVDMTRTKDDRDILQDDICSV